ncbi:DUF3293 domain-containing protein [Vibrio albus]|uniref:DUF3293 domain-containing protein n=1 Tax=Vibrio albus TaxID=2200953 RepID=A0A2U3BEZ0_9VIBR|nr:DUF3293 domain-containing protein [Vibrio albus]PWI35334.1 DUF3293 domain-containing protein [Vibrio albus]
MEIEPTLWNAYQEIFFFADKKPKFNQFCIITAWNPHSYLCSEEQNKKANSALKSELQPYKYEPILVGDRNKIWTEESYAVELSRLDSTKLAKKYRQNAIYYVQNDQIYLIPCIDCGRAETLIGCFSQRVIDLPLK